ncbi:Succinyl-CoA:coenzyme A transferase [bioreactor metagenome]|uniref:Succinyl-CoA:coenzyme A transferase n=1 Tax=bioreactor metagenome TaxID=1076179 RepID=A0A645BTI3_9ZZZZ
MGTAFIPCPAEKIAAIVVNELPERNPAFTDPDDDSAAIAKLILELLQRELAKGRLKTPITIQSGVGSVANAVLAGLQDCNLGGMEMYTEVLQDGALRLLESGRITAASSTALSLSKEMEAHFYEKFDDFKGRIVLRPQDVSNSGALIRRLGIVGMNTAVEADIYGNVNSTHVMGTNIINGIGGSGDFARNGGLSIFMTPSTAKGGAISCIVPMVSHVDSTEHDVQIIVTEQGLADLRGLAPKERAGVIIEKCAHPDYRGALQTYFEEACKKCGGAQTPHVLEKALSWHIRYRDTGTMKE